MGLNKIKETKERCVDDSLGGLGGTSESLIMGVFCRYWRVVFTMRKRSRVGALRDLGVASISSGVSLRPTIVRRVHNFCHTHAHVHVHVPGLLVLGLR